MKKRPHAMRTKAEVETLTLGEINAEISRGPYGATRGGTSQGRKAFFERLVWLEKQRETQYGIPAKHRDYRRMP